MFDMTDEWDRYRCRDDGYTPETLEGFVDDGTANLRPRRRQLHHHRDPRRGHRRDLDGPQRLRGSARDAAAHRGGSC